MPRSRVASPGHVSRGWRGGRDDAVVGRTGGVALSPRRGRQPPPRYMAGDGESGYDSMISWVVQRIELPGFTPDLWNGEYGCACVCINGSACSRCVATERPRAPFSSTAPDPPAPPPIKTILQDESPSRRAWLPLRARRVGRGRDRVPLQPEHGPAARRPAGRRAPPRDAQHRRAQRRVHAAHVLHPPRGRQAHALQHRRDHAVRHRRLLPDDALPAQRRRRSSSETEARAASLSRVDFLRIVIVASSPPCSLPP